MFNPDIGPSSWSLSSVTKWFETVSREVLDATRLPLAALMLSACAEGLESHLDASSKDQNSTPHGDTAVTGTILDTAIGLDSGMDSGGDPSTRDTGLEVEEPPEEVPDNMAPWPPSDSLGVNMASALMAVYPGFEPSGVVWAEDLEAYFIIGDDGDLAQLSGYGLLENYWAPGGNLEGITYDGLPGIFFLADESTSSIKGFDVSTGVFTESSCALSDLPVAAPFGFEALGFVSSEYAPEAWGTDPQGFFVAGTQLESDLYVYAASDCQNGGAVVHVATVSTITTDVSGIYFEPLTERLYVLHDTDNSFDLLKLDDGDGTWVNTYRLPTGSGESTWAEQEGIALSNIECGDDYAHATADLSIVDDKGGWYVWAGFPVACQY